MMVGTLAVLHYGLQTGIGARALTLAFTTFVLFQFFNVFNARVERGTAFNRHFFDNHDALGFARRRDRAAAGRRALGAGAVDFWDPNHDH